MYRNASYHFRFVQVCCKSHGTKVQRASFVSPTLESEAVERAARWTRGSEGTWKSKLRSLAPYGKTQKRVEWAFKRVAADSRSGSTRCECYTTSSTMAEAAASYNTVGNGRAINSYNFYRI